LSHSFGKSLSPAKSANIYKVENRPLNLNLNKILIARLTF
jgi:hypothetical protein